jgi:hypothetical protein
MATALQYFQQSPVRGQLEPPDATTRPGWRYLQCTDTPNELKGKKFVILWSPTTDTGSPVLLPPRASQVYAYLLSQEQVELTRGAEASWERLMHVRHLKDRMISERSLLSRVHYNLNYQQREMQAPCSHQSRAWERGSIPHPLRPSGFHSQGTLTSVADQNNQIIKSDFRNSRSGTGIDMSQTTLPHHSLKRVVNRIPRANIRTVLEG